MLPIVLHVRSDDGALSGFDELQPHETELFDAEGSPHGTGAVGARIRWLVAERLESLGHSADGWEWLFRDSRDGRLWELTFPYGSLHGGGPGRLAVVPREVMAVKYGLDARE
jgi:hypothetical protein